MITYKYCVFDDQQKIQDKCFNSFEQAYDYAQSGLLTFIVRTPQIDGVDQEDGEQMVWSWDDTHNKEEAIAREKEILTAEEAEDELDSEVDEEEAADFRELAHALYGDDMAVFDQEMPGAVAEIDIIAAEYPVDDEPVEEELNESIGSKDMDEFFRLCDEIGLKTLKDIEAFRKENPGDLLDALRKYRAELGPDFNIPEKERGLYREPKKEELTEDDLFDVFPEDSAACRLFNKKALDEAEVLGYSDHDTNHNAYADYRKAQDKYNGRLAAFDKAVKPEKEIDSDDDWSDEEFVEAFRQELVKKNK